MLGKRGFEFSFAWIFAVIVGAFILVLAIYAVTKVIETEKYNLNTETAAQLSVIFEPMETGLAEARLKIVKFNQETKIFNECAENGDFGRNKISLSVKTGLGNWQEPGGDISIKNKYLFSNKIESGKEIMLLSKSLNLPFKVSDLIIFSSKAYCFVEPIPELIKNEFPIISEEGCTPEMPLVCFSKERTVNTRVCKIGVLGCEAGRDIYCKHDYYYGYIYDTATGIKKFYIGGLIYAAIYSDPDIYECNVKRIMNRFEKETKIFMDESNFLYGKCGTVSPGQGDVNFVGLLDLINSINSITTSEDLVNTAQPLPLLKIIEDLETQNDAAECSLW